VALTDEVRQWLDDQGFALEMRAAAAFREAGFEVRQSRHFMDAETGKAREIDVLATDPDIMGIVAIHFAIECKSTKKPWVLLASEDVLSGCNRLFAFGVLTEKTIRAFAEHIRELLDTLPWLRKRVLSAIPFVRPSVARRILHTLLPSR
jgi:hypothetical protein